MCKFLRNSLSGHLETEEEQPSICLAILNGLESNSSNISNWLCPARPKLPSLVESMWDAQITCLFSLSLQLFEGNIHYDIPEVRRFDPVPAQYIRVHPERWSPAGIGMRLEVLGCDWTGRSSCVSVHWLHWGCSRH